MHLSDEANKHSRIYQKQSKDHEWRSSYSLTKEHGQILKKHGMIDAYPTFAQYMRTGGIDPYAVKHHFEHEDWRKYCTKTQNYNQQLEEIGNGCHTFNCEKIIASNVIIEYVELNTQKLQTQSGRAFLP